MKRFLSLGLLMLISLSTYAQEAAKVFWSDPFNHPMLPVYIVTAFIFVVICLVIAVAIYLIRILNLLTQQAEKEKAEKLGIPLVRKPGLWDQLVQQMNASVPVEQEKNIELDHDYDGIKELDNHLPPWWKWLFYTTIGWSAVYVIVYHFSNSLPLQQQEYEHELVLANEQLRKFKASQPQATIDENTVAYTADATLILKGKDIFLSNNCGSCHRNDGGGNMIGPNLADEYWLHGASAKQVYSTIKNGVVEKGMPAWGKALSPQDIRDVTFFILSLQGSNPKDAKGPQGEFIQNTIQADSLKTQASL